MAELLTLRRFLELERRVSRIETKLGITASPPEPEVSLGLEEPAAPVAVASAPVHGTEQIPAARGVAPEPAVSSPPVTAKPPATPPPLPVPRPAPVVAYAQPAPKKERKDTGGALETMIGLNWTGWIGAIVLVIGSALGIKYGYEQGWFQGLPRELRLGFCFSVGLALLGVGEWVDRRVNRISAAGVFAAGIATLFVVSYAGFGYFELYAQPTAFVLMAVATLIGSVIALRKNLVVVATLSLIGGNLAPLILHTTRPQTPALLGYILALQVVALFLANVGKGGKWWVLRGFAIAMPAIWTGVAYLQSPAATLPLVFSVVYAVLVQAELIVSSGRPESRQRGLITPASLLTTVLLTISLLWGLHDYSRQFQALTMLTLAAVCFAPGLILRASRPELSFAYRVSAVLLLLVAVPVGLTGASVLWVWAGLSVAYVIVGNRLDSDVGRGFGMAAWCLAVGRAAILFDHTAWWLGLPAYFYHAAGLALIGHVLSHLMARPRARVGTTIDILAGLVFLASMNALSGWHATAAVVAYAWAMFMAGRVLGRDSWELFGGALLLVALMKWACIDMLTARFDTAATTTRYLPVLNPAMALGVAIAGSVMGVYAIQRRELDERLSALASSGAMVVATFVIAMMTFGLSVEIADVARHAVPGAWPRWILRHMGWSLLWTGAIAIHAGLIFKLVAVNHRRRWLAGSTYLMLLVAGKFLVIDVILCGLSWGRFSPAPVVNVQTMTCLVVCGGLGLVWWLRDRLDQRWALGGAMMVAILLVVGTAEIGRTFAHLGATGAVGGARFAAQMAISIYWALFAVAAIVAGFRLRIAGLRYFGLTLLAVALVKVVGFDLKEIGHGYRILSFIGLGGLMLATSVLYGKLSPILLKEAPRTA